MGLLERVVDVFEARVKKLVQITTISELPQWTDADVIAADCLLKQYRNLTSQSIRPDETEAQLQTFDGITCEATNTKNQQSGG